MHQTGFGVSVWTAQAKIMVTSLSTSSTCMRRAFDHPSVCHSSMRRSTKSQYRKISVKLGFHSTDPESPPALEVCFQSEQREVSSALQRRRKYKIRRSEINWVEFTETECERMTVYVQSLIPASEAYRPYVSVEFLFLNSRSILLLVIERGAA